MPKRNLRIIKSSGGTPIQGVCEHCNMVFSATRNDAGFVSDKDEVRDQFDKHKCAPQDASQAAARIVREATEE
jgi:hypothetical protein